MAQDAFDVVVVGGSFAGLAAALQLGRARRRVLVVDAGKPRNRFAAASHGFPGQDGRSPAEILDTFRAEALAYPTIRFLAGEAREARAAEDGGFVVELAGGDAVRARRLVLATGVVDDLPAIPGLAERWGVTVLHCPYCHGYEVADRRLGVLATDAAAVPKSLLLLDWSADVTLFTAGALTLDDDQRALLEARAVRVEERPVVELVGEGTSLEGVRVEGGEVVAVDAMFSGYRTRMASPLAGQLGCAFDDGHAGPVVRTDMRRQTTVPGVFSAGDAAREPHNATFAAADGVMAGTSAHQSLALEGWPVAAPAK